MIKQTYIEKNIAAVNAIYRFMDDNDMDYSNPNQLASVIQLVQDLGAEIDACSICGAIPMNTNCNNAGCSVWLKYQPQSTHRYP